MKGWTNTAPTDARGVTSMRGVDGDDCLRGVPLGPECAGARDVSGGGGGMLPVAGGGSLGRGDGGGSLPGCATCPAGFGRVETSRGTALSGEAGCKNP